MHAAQKWTSVYVVPALLVLAGFLPGSTSTISELPDANNSTKCSEDNPNCASSKMAEVAELEKLFHIEQIKQKILHKLGLQEPPKDSVKNVPAEVLNEALKEIKFKHKKVTSHLKKYISFSEKVPGNVQRIRFRINDDGLTSSQQEITRMKLFMMVMHKRHAIPSEALKRKLVHINVYHHQDQPEKQRKLVLSSKLSVKKSKWRKLTLPPSLAQNVIDSSYGNHSVQYLDLEVECLDCDKNVYPLLAANVNYIRKKLRGEDPASFGAKRLNNRRPFLIIRSREKARSRSKRNTNLCSPSSTECCVVPLKIDFRQLGWDFLIEPTTYNANYCRGQCRENLLPNEFAFGHTHIIQSAEAKSGFCCSPRKMSPMSMLYMHEGNVIQNDVDDMIVEECGCA